MSQKKTTQHVVTNPDGGWSVKRGGASRASGTFMTQQEAVASARKIATNQGADIVIHGKNGRIVANVTVKTSVGKKK